MKNKHLILFLILEVFLIFYLLSLGQKTDKEFKKCVKKYDSKSDSILRCVKKENKEEE